MSGSCFFILVFFLSFFFSSLESVLLSRFIAQCAIENVCSLFCPCIIAMNSNYFTFFSLFFSLALSSFSSFDFQWIIYLGSPCLSSESFAWLWTHTRRAWPFWGPSRIFYVYFYHPYLYIGLYQIISYITIWLMNLLSPGLLVRRT